MSGETIVVYGGTVKTLESSGSSIANNALVKATNTYGVVADGSSYPHAGVVGTFTFATAPTEGTQLALYARALDVDGTADTEVPETTRPTRLVGTFTVNNVTTAQTIELDGVGMAFDLPKLAEYYVHNNGTGQSVSAGWSLKFTPRTYTTAP